MLPKHISLTNTIWLNKIYLYDTVWPLNSLPSYPWTKLFLQIIILFSWPTAGFSMVQPQRVCYVSFTGGVYMIPARLSFRYEFTPVPSCGSVFVYMIPAQNLVPERVIPVRVHPGNCTGARFSFRYENSSRSHVNAVQLFAPVWSHSPGSLERVAQSLISNPIWRHLGVTITSVGMKCPFT